MVNWLEVGYHVILVGFDIFDRIWGLIWKNLYWIVMSWLSPSCDLCGFQGESKVKLSESRVSFRFMLWKAVMGFYLYGISQDLLRDATEDLSTFWSQESVFVYGSAYKTRLILFRFYLSFRNQFSYTLVAKQISVYSVSETWRTSTLQILFNVFPEFLWSTTSTWYKSFLDSFLNYHNEAKWLSKEKVVLNVFVIELCGCKHFAFIVFNLEHL